MTEVNNMKLKNTKTGETFSIHFHANNKVPTYFEAGEKSVPATVNGEKTKLVLNPKRATSNRVNFQYTSDKGVLVNAAVDNDVFWTQINELVEKKSKAVVALELAEGRVKAATEAPAAEAAAVAA